MLLLNTKKVLAVVLTIFLSAQILTAGHKYHTSFTRIDYNREAKLLEFTIKVFSHDLQPVFEQRFGQKFDQKDDSVKNQKLLEYLNEKFIFETKDGQKKSFNWVGSEWEAGIVYIYVEIPYESELENSQLINSLFVDKFSDQVNLVTIRDGEKKTDFVFKAGSKKKIIEF